MQNMAYIWLVYTPNGGLIHQQPVGLGPLYSVSHVILPFPDSYSCMRINKFISLYNTTEAIL